MERKTAAVEWKEDSPGSFVARVSSLNVIDKDGDVTLPGAFPSGRTVLVSAYGHTSWQGQLPIGKATLRERGNEVIAEGQLNLASTVGNDHYETLKFAPELQEWSYGFAPTEFSFGEFEGQQVRFLKGLDVFEVSPVLIGAGENTATLSVKAAKLTYAENLQEVLKAAQELNQRTQERAAFRAKEGRSLSSENRERLSELAEELAATTNDLKALLADKPEGEAGNAEALKLFAEYQKLKARLNGVAT